MKKLLLALAAILCAALQSCEKSGAPEIEPEFLSFAFYKSSNSSLYQDIVFESLEPQNLTHLTTFPLNDLTLAASFTVPEGCVVTVDNIVQTSSKTANDFSQPVEYTITNDKGEQRVYTVSLSVDYKELTGLPVMFINTKQGAPIRDKENWIAGDFSILGNDGKYIIEGNELEIRGRGNTTWYNPKKPYALKLSKKTELFGMPKHKRWVLLAAYNDKSMIRTDLATPP